MEDLPFDVSTHIDENLRDVANNPDEMTQAFHHLFAVYRDEEHEPRNKIELLGRIGSYARIVGLLEIAHETLTQAITQSHAMGDELLILINEARLAHVYQWKRDFEMSNKFFEELLERVKNSESFGKHKDFIYQHAAKNLFDQERYSQALELFERAHDIRVAKGDKELLESTALGIAATKKRIGID